MLLFFVGVFTLLAKILSVWLWYDVVVFPWGSLSRRTNFRAVTKRRGLKDVERRAVAARPENFQGNSLDICSCFLPHLATLLANPY